MNRMYGRTFKSEVKIALMIPVIGLGLCGCDEKKTAGETDEKTMKVGVLLPLTGEEALGWKEVLDWAAEDINRANAFNGAEIELVYIDTAVAGISEGANRLLSDTNIKATIGANTSSELEETASRFIRKEQVLISPSATSEDIFKTYAGKKFIWRTVESDTAQLEVMLASSALRGAKTGALIAGWDSYGSTFFNWFGFLAVEAGIEPVGIARYKSSETDCEPALETALASAPDVLFAATLHVNMAACIWKHARELLPGIRVIFSDGAYLPDLPKHLGALAEGLEGFVPSEDPDSGFQEAFEARFHSRPTPFSANVYDALLLVAYGLAASNGEGGPALAEALIRLVDSRGEPFGWGMENLEAALSSLVQGDYPDISGASGPLDFDLEFHTDPMWTHYSRWVIEDGVFVEKEFFFTKDVRRTLESAVRQTASDEQMQQVDDSPKETAPRTGLKALIVAGSDKWENYRHQSDALSHYQLLKKNGVEDEQIILVTEDDIADHPSNPYPGVIEQIENGENLYEEVEVDYTLAAITAAKLLDILSGKRSDTLDRVIESGPGDNLYVFFSGHGNQDGVFIGSADPLVYQPDSLLTPSAVNTVLNEMHALQKYRQVFWVVEACHSGALGQALDAPNALMLTAATPYENSIAANRREIDQVWLADQFSYEFIRVASEHPDMSLLDAYVWTYLRVNGSHVTLYNHQNFEGASSAPLKDFLSPRG